jgi:hypothetical protein
MRRRAAQFELEVEPEGPVRYLRGSIQPSAASTQTLRWTLSNVITAQQIALSLPEESEGSQSYLQALSALPAALVIFLIGVITVGIRSRRLARADRLAAGAALFAFGLGSAVVLSNYVGPLAGLILGPVFGALMAPMALGPRALLSSVPAALVPAAFISPHHSGLVILLIGLLAIAAVHASGRRTSTGY